MVIFHCYVSSPEGIHPFSYGFFADVVPPRSPRPWTQAGGPVETQVRRGDGGFFGGWKSRFVGDSLW